MWLSQTVKFMWCFLLVEVYIHTSEQNDVYIGVIYGHETDDAVYKNILTDAVANVNRNSTFLSGQHQMELKEQTLYANYVYPSLQEVCNTMVQTERVSALILPEDVCPMCGDIAAMASHATSPVFSLDPGSLKSGSVAFKMYPSPSDISEFFLDMLIYFQWRSFMIIYDTDQIYANLEDVISAGNIYKWNITLRKYDNNFNRIVDFIREEEIRNIFLYTSTEKTTRKIMEMGLDEGVVSDQHHWIIGNIDVYLDRVFLEDLEVSRAYMTRFKMNYTTQWQYSYPSSPDRRLTEWPLRERLSFDAVMTIAHGMRRYRERVRADEGIEDINILPGDTMMNSCPINSDPPTRAEWNEDLTYYTFEGLTGNVAFDSNGDRVNYTIMVYSGQGETFDTVRGEWSQNPAHWESRYDIEWKSEGRLNVTKYVLGLERRLKVVSILQAPFLMYRDNADRYRGNARFRGYIMDLLEEIARVVKGINFEYEVELVADGKYGRRDEYSNEWDGMIGELVRRKADIAAGPVSITNERNQAVDFSYPFMHSGLQILIKHPNHVLDDPFAFLYPFGIEVWFLNAICFLMVSAVLWAINSFNPYEWKAAVERHETFGENVDNFNFKNSLWFSASTLVFQSYDASPRSTAGRVVAGFWWVFVVIMVFLYLTNLTFWLTASKRLATIRSAEDLLEQYEIKYGVVDEGSVYYFLKNSSNPDFQQMYSTVENTIPKPTVANVSEGVRRVRESNGDYAFIDETGILRYQADQAEPCDLYVTGGFISRNSYGLAVQKDSPLRDQLSYAIETLRDTRSLEQLERQWWQWDSKCGNLTTWEKQGIYSLTSVDLFGVYLLLIIGSVAAGLIFLIECMCTGKDKNEFRVRSNRDGGVGNGGGAVGGGRPIQPTAAATRQSAPEKIPLDSPGEGQKYWI